MWERLVGLSAEILPSWAQIPDDTQRLSRGTLFTGLL